MPGCLIPRSLSDFRSLSFCHSLPLSFPPCHSLTLSLLLVTHFPFAFFSSLACSFHHFLSLAPHVCFLLSLASPSLSHCHSLTPSFPFRHSLSLFISFLSLVFPSNYEAAWHWTPFQPGRLRRALVRGLSGFASGHSDCYSVSKSGSYSVSLY